MSFSESLFCGFSFSNTCITSGFTPTLLSFIYDLNTLRHANVDPNYDFLFLDKIALEGVVVQRAECRPAVSESYMKLKR